MKNNIQEHKILYLIIILISLLIIVNITMKNKEKNIPFRILKSIKSNRMKYILQWTSPNTVPFNDMGEGQSGFIRRNCSYINCYVTPNMMYLGDIKKFDVIAFAGPQLMMNSMDQEIPLPSKRSPHQKYVFASIESAENYPVLTTRYNGYFNWTWTYRLDSEIRWGYIIIRDSKGKIIGPQKEMHWIKLEDMSPVSEIMKDKLKNKRKAAAWFVSNCRTIRERELFANELGNELIKNQQILDIYGDCGYLSCPRDNQEKCNKIINSTYYFYLSFENSFSEDYVTEKLLLALQNNVVPIVFGGANYSRFMPDGSYLDARQLGVTNLVAKMVELIHNPEQYSDYFRWKNHYSYHATKESAESNEYCKMCALLNDEDMMRKYSVYDDFKTWWNGPGI